MLTETHNGIIYEVRIEPAEADRRVARLLAGLWGLYLRIEGPAGRQASRPAGSRGCNEPGAADLPGSPGVLEESQNTPL